MTARSSIGVVDLIAEIIRRAARLPRALCRGKWAVFDGDDEESTALALQLCGWCLELDPCRAWRDEHHSRDVTGVVAGEVAVWPK